MKRVAFIFGLIVLAIIAVVWIRFRSDDEVVLQDLEIGDVVGELNGVKIYYNGSVGTVRGRNQSADGYNLGLRYQCVEFVKRYYFERLNHRMPNTWGHARDFFDAEVPNGKLNPARALTQYRNGEASKPKADDLLVFGPTRWNKFGHVAIVASVGDRSLEIAQQNPGPEGKARVTMKLLLENGRWKIDDKRVLGWLRKR